MWDLHANWGKTKKIEVDGKLTDVTIDENYVLESIVAPWEKIVPTYLNQMPANFGQQLGPKNWTHWSALCELDQVVDPNGELRTNLNPPPTDPDHFFPRTSDGHPHSC